MNIVIFAIDPEKVILGIGIYHNSQLPIIFDNCDADFFTSKAKRELFKTMQDLNSEGIAVEVGEIWERLARKGLDFDDWSVEEDFLRGIAGRSAEQALIKYIQRVKRARARHELLREVGKEAEYNNPDWEKLDVIVDKGKGIETQSREDMSLEEAGRKYTEWIQREDAGIFTGFPILDQKTDSYNFGELVSILGRPMTGKTFLGLEIMRHVVKTTAYKIGFFSLEMPKQTLVERMMQGHYNFSRWELKDMAKNGKLVAESFYQDYSQTLISDKSQSVASMASVIRERRLKVVFIDFFNIIKDRTEGTLYQQGTEKIKNLKNMAKDEDCLVFALMQLSRSTPEYVKVRLDSARDTGAIEENSDFMIGISNPSANDKMREEDRMTWDNCRHLGLVKNKRGVTGGVRCSFDSKSGRLKEIDTQHYDGGDDLNSKYRIG